MDGLRYKTRTPFWRTENRSTMFVPILARALCSTRERVSPIVVSWSARNCHLWTVRMYEKYAASALAFFAARSKISLHFSSQPTGLHVSRKTMTMASEHATVRFLRLNERGPRIETEGASHRQRSSHAQDRRSNKHLWFLLSCWPGRSR